MQLNSGATFHDVEQNTDDWFAMRCGKVGGSSIGSIMANYGKAFGPPAHELAQKIALEQITGIPISSGFTSPHLDRGHEQEPIARGLYEAEYFCEVTNGGFIENGDCGVSPDGFNGGNLIEIKSVIYKVQFANLKRDNYDPKHKWQLFFNMQQCGCEWIDFVSFCAQFPIGKQLFCRRVLADQSKKEFAMMDVRMAEFRVLVQDKIKIINNA